MGDKFVLLGSSVQSPVENKTRKEVTLPGTPSQDFILTARCRIVAVGRRVSISAADLPGSSGSTFSWSTSSSKIRLVNTTGPTLAIEGVAVGSARDSESITCTCKSKEGGQTSKTVSLTVATVVFEKSALQTFGFDDFDSPSDHTDDHICVKSSAETFVRVKIEGGAVGSDFSFECIDPNVCSTKGAPSLDAFDLAIQGGRSNKASTVLQAKVKCPSSEVFASIAVHVYAEKIVKVLIAKVADSRSPMSALKFGTADYASHQVKANDKLKEAVVRYELENFDAGNMVTDIPFDKDGNGVLSFDINSGGGVEFEMIKQAIKKRDADQYRVVIVRGMKSFYYLDRPARKGDTSISVRGPNIFTTTMPLGNGPSMEIVTVTSSSGQLASPLRFDHPIGEPLEFPAAGWSTDPILIMEGGVSLDVTKWTILHEVGHSALKLMDVVDPTDFMHYSQVWTDFRLRYSPRNSKYKPGKQENQWEQIPRERN